MSALFQLNKEFYERLTNRLVYSLYSGQISKDLDGINYLKINYSPSAGTELNPPQFICEGTSLNVIAEGRIDNIADINKTIILNSNTCSCNDSSYQNEILFKLNLNGQTGAWQVINRAQPPAEDYYLQINFGVPSGESRYINIFEYGYYDEVLAVFHSYFYIITPIICITSTTNIFLILNTTFELPPNCLL